MPVKKIKRALKYLVTYFNIGTQKQKGRDLRNLVIKVPKISKIAGRTYSRSSSWEFLYENLIYDPKTLFEFRSHFKEMCIPEVSSK